ncbi:MAG: YbaN family protein [Acidobacteria bacterium]|nr:YbaN family protein [Acidobacteriota bacterium]
MKVVFIVIGSISLGLGILGIFLPLLPTTPFLLLTSACYLRGSDRLHNWLMSNKHLGGYIRNIKEGRGIPLRAKIITIAVLWASLIFSISRMDMLFVTVVLVLMGFGATLFLLIMETLIDDE